MNKFDGLEIEKKFSSDNEFIDNENQFDLTMFSDDNSNEYSQKFAEEQIIPISNKKKNKCFTFFKSLIFLLISSVTIWAGYKGYLAPVKIFLDSEYNYSEKDLVDINDIKYTFCNLFNIAQVVNLNKLEQIEIKKPFVAMDIIEEDGNLVFKNLESVFLRIGTDCKVTNITDTLGGRKVEVLCSNGCTLVYSGLTYIGTEKNRMLKSGDLFGASNGDIIMSLYFKNEKINLALDKNGKIIWQN